MTARYLVIVTTYSNTGLKMDVRDAGDFASERDANSYISSECDAGMRGPDAFGNTYAYHVEAPRSAGN